MNRQIIKLFGFIVVLFAILVGFTSWWSVFDAKALKEKRANQRPLLEQQQIPRGRILADDGQVIAKSYSKGHGTGKRYIRKYPMGSLFGHPIGYSFVKYGQTEFEKSHNSELTGEESEFGSIVDELTGKKQEGEQIVTNLDPKAQEVAMADLENAGYGAVVAIEPSTGEVKVLASNPGYDPNRIPKELTRLSKQEVEHPAGQPGDLRPLPAGLDLQGRDRRGGARIGGHHPGNDDQRARRIIDEGHELANDYRQDWGDISLDTALTYSVNTWFGQLGQKIGQNKLFTMMEKFGFNSTPPIDLPEDELDESGVYDYESDSLLTRKDPVDLARVAIGQERLLATPLQIAMVASAVANGGKLMKPQIWNRVVNSDGSVTKRMDPGGLQRTDLGEDRGRADDGDGRRGRRRDRDQRGDLRGPGGGQDRHRGNAGQQGLRRRRGREPGLVHGLRAGRPSEDRDRGVGRVHRSSSATTSRRRSSATSPKRSWRANEGPGR